MSFALNISFHPIRSFYLPTARRPEQARHPRQGTSTRSRKYPLIEVGKLKQHGPQLVLQSGHHVHERAQLVIAIDEARFMRDRLWNLTRKHEVLGGLFIPAAH